MICTEPRLSHVHPDRPDAHRLAPACRRASAARSRSQLRGFTLAELLAVLAIIGILAAAASPVFVSTMRDGRVSSAASQLAEIYRLARSRALGRGACVMVRFDDSHAVPTTADLAGHATIREAILGSGGNCSVLPSPGCTTVDWTSNGESRFVASFDERTKLFEPAQALLYDPGNTHQAFSEIAFSPRGRAYVRYAAADSFVPLRGVVRIEVQNTTTTFTRQVIVPPNGAARVVTRM